MREEPDEGIALPNGDELAWIYIESEIEIAGIQVQQISADDTITTDREVPEEIMSRICEYAADKGITIRFRVSGQEK